MNYWIDCEPYSGVFSLHYGMHTILLKSNEKLQLIRSFWSVLVSCDWLSHTESLLFSDWMSVNISDANTCAYYFKIRFLWIVVCCMWLWKSLSMNNCVSKTRWQKYLQKASRKGAWCGWSKIIIICTKCLKKNVCSIIQNLSVLIFFSHKKYRTMFKETVNFV